MTKWRIVTDSSIDYHKDDFDLGDIEVAVVPLQIICGDNVFVDDESLDVLELLAKMEETKEASKTSCPAPGQFLESYKGAENIICFTITGALSGTYNSAVLASNMLKDENKDANIFVLDSHSTGGHLVLLLDKTKELIEKGLSFEEICNELTEYNKQIQIMAILGSFENLVKTGRMNPIVGAIAEKLSVKAIIENDLSGQIHPIKKTRGLRGAYSKLVDSIFEVKKDLTNLPMYISHCNNLEGALKVKELIEAKGKNNKVTITSCKGLTTFYVMEKGIIVGF